MLKLEVFDPPMCCSSGICGSNADLVLVTFASDLEWLKQQGVEVIRHGLSFEPTAFAENDAVKNLVNKYNNSCLPIITVEGKIVSDSCYPSREDLARFCKIKYNEDEAPPIHREENCCCGIDCDCSSSQLSESSCSTEETSSGIAKNNHYCVLGSTKSKSISNNKFKIEIFSVLLLIILGIILFILIF